MLIRIVYKDGQQQLVRPNVLDKLIADNAIIKFERSDGWAVLGDAPLRAKGTGAYRGQERRAEKVKIPIKQ